MSTTLNAAVAHRDGSYHPTHGVVRKNFTFRDTSAGTEQIIGVLPAGAAVTSGMVWVKTAFVGTTPTITVGLAGSPALFLASTATTAIGGTALTAALLIAAAAVPTTSARNIVVVIGGTTVTAGSLDVIVEFSP